MTKECLMMLFILWQLPHTAAESAKRKELCTDVDPLLESLPELEFFNRHNWNLRLV